MTALSRRSVLLGATATALLGAASYGFASYNAALGGARRRVTGASQLIAAPLGELEYATGGEGEPLLMVHGTGGGFDQGLRFGRALMARGFRIIAPSRFGYLQSSYPDDPSPARQADALVALLDHLGIARLPVAGGSAGASTAAEFALRHPDRCSALILLVPAMNLTGRDPVEFTPLQRFLVSRLLTSDAWFWLLSRAFPGQLIGTLLATDPKLLQTVSPAERERARLILQEIMPVSARSCGMLNDGHHAGSSSDIDLTAITVPALIVSAEDDRFGTADTARLIASRITGSRLIIYPTGGHIWLGHDDELADEIAAFVRESVVAGSRPAPEIVVEKS